MAILGARAWDSGNLMLNSADYSMGAGSFISVATNVHHTGSYSLYFQPKYPSWARWAIAGTPANPSVSIWLYATGGYYNATFRLRLLLGTGQYIDLRWNNATHTFDAYVDNVLVASGTVEVSNVNVWFNVQTYSLIADAGSIHVRIDGHESIAYTGDTQPGAATGASYFYIYSNTAPAEDFWFVDDFVWGTGGYLGACEVYDKIVNSDDTVAWTPSTGAVNYAMEDEVPPSDADYNETAVTATVDKLGLAALSLTDRVVDAVIGWSRAADPDTHGSSIKVGIDSNGTESTATHGLAAAYEYYWGPVDEVDPDDSAAWNQAKVDALLHMKESVIP